jgi:hypothetical protein
MGDRLIVTLTLTKTQGKGVQILGSPGDLKMTERIIKQT